VLVVLVTGGLGHALANRARGPEVEAVQARRGELVQKVVVAGRVTPPSQVRVASQVAGTVQAGRELLVLARTGATRLPVEPDEKNLAFIRPGQRALASADAFPQERFGAAVESVAPGVNPERGAAEVKLSVPTPPPYLRPDMAVSLEIEVARKDGAVLVPAEAVRDVATAATWAWGVREGRAQRVEVKAGLSGEGKLELLSGPPEGDWLLTGKAPVTEGGRVRVKARAAGGKP